jgi:hypothetical protein
MPSLPRLAALVAVTATGAFLGIVLSRAITGV